MQRAHDHEPSSLCFCLITRVPSLSLPLSLSPSLAQLGTRIQYVGRRHTAGRTSTLEDDGTKEDAADSLLSREQCSSQGGSSDIVFERTCEQRANKRYPRMTWPRSYRLFGRKAIVAAVRSTWLPIEQQKMLVKI
eukprot:2892794-Rhodomonas_salina.2